MAINREIVAYHEAGHAVAARMLELAVVCITIQPSDDAAGHVVHDYGCNMNEIVDEDGPDKQWALERAAICTLAGEVAQRRFRAESVTEGHGGGDREQLHHMLDHLAGEYDQELRDAWERLLVLRTERLIGEHWHCVEWVASLLMKHTTIEGADEIRHAIADAEIPLEYRGKRLSFSDRLALCVGKKPRTAEGEQA